MKKNLAARLLFAIVVSLLLSLGHLACGGDSKTPTSPGFNITPTPGMVPTPTPGGGY